MQIAGGSPALFPGSPGWKNICNLINPLRTRCPILRLPWDKSGTRKTLFIPEGQLGMLFTQNACRSLRLLSGNSHGREVLWVRTDSVFLFSFFFLVFTGRTLEVLARGEALVRGEHGPLLHGHPAGHADQARLKVCGSQRARRGEKRAGDVTKRTVTGEGWAVVA